MNKVLSFFVTIPHWRYLFMHWLFQWKQDKDGDVSFVIANCLSFTKYKEHTIIKLDGRNLQRAGKWQGYIQPAQNHFNETGEIR